MAHGAAIRMGVRSSQIIPKPRSSQIIKLGGSELRIKGLSNKNNNNNNTKRTSPPAARSDKEREAAVAREILVCSREYLARGSAVN